MTSLPSPTCEGILAPHPAPRVSRFAVGNPNKPYRSFYVRCEGCADHDRRSGVLVERADRRREARTPISESELRALWGDR